THSTIHFFFSSRRRHTRFSRDWSSDVCSSDLNEIHNNSIARLQLCCLRAIFPKSFSQNINRNGHKENHKQHCKISIGSVAKWKFKTLDFLLRRKSQTFR